MSTLFDLKAPGNDTKHKAILEGTNLKIVDPDLQKKINSVKLSPSMINSILSSPGDWVISKYIESDVLLDELDFLIRGNWFHSIMENFFSKSAGARSVDELKKSVRTVSAQEKYKPLLANPDNKEWLKKALANYINTFYNEDSKEKVAEVFLNGKKQKGVELFVNGTIGEAKRKCLGFIDRVTEGINGLKVHDWKTGGRIENFNPEKKISDSNSFDYWRQQTFYALLLQQKGMKIEEAALIFPCAKEPQKIYIPFDDEKVIEQTIKDTESCDKILAECIENDYTFPMAKGKWNKWASYLCGLGSSPMPKINEDKLQSIIKI